MSYDHWKTTEPDDGAEMPQPGETELELLYARERRLRVSHDRLLAAADRVAKRAEMLRAAIAAAEELAP